jgi:hypothetical protein
LNNPASNIDPSGLCDDDDCEKQEEFRMQLQDVGIQIATRTLSVGGKQVTVVIEKPEEFPEGDNFYCRYQITGIGNGRVRYAGGVDAVQALQLALKMIGAELYTSQEAKTKQLSWEAAQSPSDLGFPVPDSVKDLLP